MSPPSEPSPVRRSADTILGQFAARAEATDPAFAPWDGEPVPLSARRLLPPFPVDALPSWVGDMVGALAEFTQTPVDLAGCLALACLATAAGGRAVVESVYRRRAAAWLAQVGRVRGDDGPNPCRRTRLA